MINNIFPYFMLMLAVVFGTAANSFANTANGFTKLVPTLASAITIVLCMYFLSQAMRYLPVGVTYASFAGFCIIGTALVGIFWFNQIPNMITTLGLLLIVSGVAIVNIFGVTRS